MPDGSMLDIFGAGGTEQTARQFGLPFLGSVDLDPEIRSGGDRGLPVALGGETSERAKGFYEIARNVIARAAEVSAKSDDVLEIT
jgi:ATP-binding protein involved in chromosome partitioning